MHSGQLSAHLQWSASSAHTARHLKSPQERYSPRYYGDAGTDGPAPSVYHTALINLLTDAQIAAIDPQALVTPLDAAVDPDDHGRQLAGKKYRTVLDKMNRKQLLALTARELMTEVTFPDGTTRPLITAFPLDNGVDLSYLESSVLIYRVNGVRLVDRLNSQQFAMVSSAQWADQFVASDEMQTGSAINFLAKEQFDLLLEARGAALLLAPVRNHTTYLIRLLDDERFNQVFHYPWTNPQDLLTLFAEADTRQLYTLDRQALESLIEAGLLNQLDGTGQPLLSDVRFNALNRLALLGNEAAFYPDAGRFDAYLQQFNGAETLVNSVLDGHMGASSLARQDVQRLTPEQAAKIYKKLGAKERSYLTVAQTTYLLTQPSTGISFDIIKDFDRAVQVATIELWLGKIFQQKYRRESFERWVQQIGLTFQDVAHLGYAVEMLPIEMRTILVRSMTIDDVLANLWWFTRQEIEGIPVPFFSQQIASGETSLLQALDTAGVLNIAMWMMLGSDVDEDEIVSGLRPTQISLLEPKILSRIANDLGNAQIAALTFFQIDQLQPRTAHRLAPFLSGPQTVRLFQRDDDDYDSYTLNADSFAYVVNHRVEVSEQINLWLTREIEELSDGTSPHFNHPPLVAALYEYFSDAQRLLVSVAAIQGMTRDEVAQMLDAVPLAQHIASLTPTQLAMMDSQRHLIVNTLTPAQFAALTVDQLRGVDSESGQPLATLLDAAHLRLLTPGVLAGIFDQLGMEQITIAVVQRLEVGPWLLDLLTLPAFLPDYVAWLSPEQLLTIVQIVDSNQFVLGQALSPQQIPYLTVAQLTARLDRTTSLHRAGPLVRELREAQVTALTRAQIASGVLFEMMPALQFRDLTYQQVLGALEDEHFPIDYFGSSLIPL